MKGVQEQSKGQEELSKKIRADLDLMEQKKKKQKELVGDLEKEKKIRQEIAELNAKTRKDQELYEKNQAKIDTDIEKAEKAGRSPDRLERMILGFKGGAAEGGGLMGGMKGLAGQAGTEIAGLGMMGQVGLAIAAAAALTKVTDAIVSFKGVGMDIAKAQGSAVQSTMGRELGGIYGGTLLQEMPFQKQKQLS